MKTAYMLIGLPYSGKSTFIKEIFNEDIPVVSSDRIIEKEAFVTGEHYNKIFSSFIEKATVISNIQFLQLVLNDKDMIIDKTNLSEKSRKFFIKTLNESGYKVIGIVFNNVSILELERRMTLRTDKRIGFHILNNMKKNYKRPSLKEGFAEIVNAKNFKRFERGIFEN